MKDIIVGLIGFVLANLAVTLMYAALWPYLYNWNLIDWNDDARFWSELVLHGVLAAICGVPYCIWFGRRMLRTSIVDRIQ